MMPRLPQAGSLDASLATENQARRAVIATCLRMGAAGLNTGRAGNVSVRWNRGGEEGGQGLLITPSATVYESLVPESIIWMALDAEPSEPGADALAPRPSSEWRLHRDVYRERPDVGAVVHAHPVSATALACLPAIQASGIPAFHYMVAVAGGADIRCAPYRIFGSAELSQVAIDALRERKACLLAHHGVIALGATLADALELCAEVETLARMYSQALQIGAPAVLSAADMAEVVARFAGYRDRA
jgi:L-fuculose-phosphate aldolase